MSVYRKVFVFKRTINQLNILLGSNLSFNRSLSISHLENDGKYSVDWPPLFHCFFLVFNLTCCKIVALKENTLSHFLKIITVSRPSTLLRVFHMGYHNFPPGEELGWSPFTCKILNFLLLWHVTLPSNQKLSPLPLSFISHLVHPLITDNIIKKKYL